MIGYNTKRQLQQIEYAKTNLTLTFITSKVPSASKNIAKDKKGTLLQDINEKEIGNVIQ